jgi:riboflavin kinase/FMN adenylyltransferase
VKRLLGYGYTLSGIVEHGNAIGTTLGFPTANIALGSHKQLPAKGVYSVLANVDGVSYHAIANIGTKPTIGGENLSLEVYMFDFVGDLYGKALQVTFLDFLREEKKFASLDALKKQIASDVQGVRNALGVDDLKG